MNFSAKPVFVSLITLSLLCITISGQVTDPYMLKEGGFGYMVHSNTHYNLWWAEGAYKIMKDTPAPSGEKARIYLSAAGNEYEPFQVVLNPDHTISDLYFSISDLINGENTIKSSNVEVRRVEYVYISKPTDSYGHKGLWPDPLPELSGPVTADSATNTTIWFNIFVPPGTIPGKYRGDVLLYSSGWEEEIPVELEVWDFTLPATPSLRSGFGLSVDKIAAYHNLTDSDDIRKTFDLYMQAFRKYRISPYYFYALDPVRESIKGVAWEGGILDSANTASGKYCLMIEDESPTEVISARYRDNISVSPGNEYTISWKARAAENDQQYCILIESFDSTGKKLIFGNRMDVFKADTTWRKGSFRLGTYDSMVSSVRLSLFPALRTADGEETGTVWFDDIDLSGQTGTGNLLQQPGFEIDPDSIDITLDFSAFDKAASRYIDGFGFNSFRLDLKGLGSGTYYSRKEGLFAGFIQGSPEYGKLMGRYLSQIQDHLALKGWLGKEYVYWFDEPAREDYPFVREGMETIRRAAPGITTFLTENVPGPEIMDVTDITCTIWNRIDPKGVQKVTESGGEYWSYLCTGPKAPWITEFIDHDAINLRMWSWASFAYNLDGILVWSTNYWTSRDGSPPGYLQNPWEEPASYVQGYGWPLGKQTNWGNGDGRFWYPPNRDPNHDTTSYISGPVPSLRLEFLRQGLEDYEYLHLLKDIIDSKPVIPARLTNEAKKLLEIPDDIFKDGKTYTRDPQKLYRYRKDVADMIIRLGKVK